MNMPSELNMDDPETGLVSTQWLADQMELAGTASLINQEAHQRVRQHGLVLFDASYFLMDKTRDPHAEWLAQHIAGSGFFDITQIANTESPWPNTVPDAAKFEQAVRVLGVNNSHRVIVYDRLGLASAARVWWLFRYFGHQQVAVLDGGLPKWLNESGQVYSGEVAVDIGSFTATTNADLLTTAEEIAASIASGKAKNTDGGSRILDARAAGRFAGNSPEPRSGLRAGHIPGSLSLPYKSLLNEDSTYKAPSELSALFQAQGIDHDTNIVTTCGSGVTACIISLGLELAGLPSASMFDGSWTEWGSRDEFPVATGPAASQADS